MDTGVSGASLRESKPGAPGPPPVGSLSLQNKPTQSVLTVFGGRDPGTVWLSLCGSAPQEGTRDPRVHYPGGAPTGLPLSGLPQKPWGCPHHRAAGLPGEGDESGQRLPASRAASPGTGPWALAPYFLLVFGTESLAPAHTLQKGHHAACFGGSITWRRSRGHILSHYITHHPWAGKGDPLHGC